MSEPSKGTYALVLHLEHRAEITVGKLGTFNFRAGHYLYVGSALGPGGLEARLARHRRRDKKLHWHIDYLLEHAQLVEVWSAATEDKLECLWAQVARELPDSAVTVPGFGSSDCRCPSHLIYLTRKPSYQEFTTKLLMVGGWGTISFCPTEMDTQEEGDN
jgi:Uri superfamily endonuclease